MGADDFPVVDYPEILDWTGFYAGLSIGGGYADANSVVGQIDPAGAIVGAQAGYNYDTGSLVLGAEADLHWTGMHGSATSSLGTTATGDLDYYGTFRMRAGFDADQFMPYVTAGAAYGQATSTSTFSPGYTSTVFIGGWTAGIGAEYALNDRMTVRGELAYADFGDVTLFSGTPIVETIRVRMLTAKAGVNYRF